MVSCFSPEFEKQFGSCSYPEKGNFPGRNLKAIFPSLRKKWGVGSGGWGVTLKLVGREILSVVKLGGEKWKMVLGRLEYISDLVVNCFSDDCLPNRK